MTDTGVSRATFANAGAPFAQSGSLHRPLADASKMMKLAILTLIVCIVSLKSFASSNTRLSLLQNNNNNNNNNLETLQSSILRSNSAPTRRRDYQEAEEEAEQQAIGQIRELTQVLGNLNSLITVKRNNKQEADWNAEQKGADLALLTSIKEFCEQHPDDCNSVKAINVSDCAVLQLDSEGARVICMPVSYESRPPFDKQLTAASYNGETQIETSKEPASLQRDAATRWARSSGFNEHDDLRQQDRIIELLRGYERRTAPQPDGQWSPEAGVARWPKALLEQLFSLTNKTVSIDSRLLDGGDEQASWTSPVGQFSASRLAEQSGGQFAPIGDESRGRNSRRHRVATRAWRQQSAPPPPPQPRTFRVSHEQVERFLQAQRRRQQSAGRVVSLLEGVPSLAPMFVAPAQVATGGEEELGSRTLAAAAPVALNERNNNGAVRLHRSETAAVLVPAQSILEAAANMTLVYESDGQTANGAHGRLPREQKQQQPEQSQQAATGNDNGNQQQQRAQREGDGAPGQLESPMQCEMRRYTYRATKVDEQTGHKCAGDIVASICYGGCDSGEIADWLFPHKKSIHKVCRHGERIRRRVTLNECTSDEVDDVLREYYYVDALSCACKRCTSVDTTCLGTMTRPSLATTTEVVAAAALEAERPLAAR